MTTYVARLSDGCGQSQLGSRLRLRSVSCVPAGLGQDAVMGKPAARMGLAGFEGSKDKLNTRITDCGECCEGHERSAGAEHLGQKMASLKTWHTSRELQ